MKVFLNRFYFIGVGNQNINHCKLPHASVASKNSECSATFTLTAGQDSSIDDGTQSNARWHRLQRSVVVLKEVGPLDVREEEEGT